MSVASWLLRGLVRIYQLMIRPVLPASCRFFPSCSAYAMEALAKHGAVKGSCLAVGRICRCHPWNDGGVDPVPEPKRRPPAGAVPPGNPDRTS